ncbi:MAG: right-handed parallel beta-helix repeat-containing protein [Planctomycetia bacterium]|nr:right-handed parallel beta-helix repeat-containing protein [Planctomycetia bacterium]
MFYSQKNLSIYGNPYAPEEVKIIFDDNRTWCFEKGTRAEIIGVDVVGECGVRISDPKTNVIIRNCILHDCTDGVQVLHGAFAKIVDSEVRDCSNEGLAVRGPGCLMIAQNCSILHCNSGVRVTRNSHIYLQRCDLQDNCIGIECLSQGQAVFRDDALRSLGENWCFDQPEDL